MVSSSSTYFLNNGYFNSMGTAISTNNKLVDFAQTALTSSQYFVPNAWYNT